MVPHPSHPVVPNTLSIGLGLRRPFMEALARDRPDAIDWIEIAPENYIGRGGKAGALFEAIAAHYPVIAHGLTLSIGSVDPLDWDYLKTLKAFLRRHQIAWFSDHLCFSSYHSRIMHELFPLPFTMEAVRHVSERARIVQDFLEVPFALENISFYFHPEQPEMTESQFIQEVIHRSRTSLLLDVNNVYVNTQNHGGDARDVLRQLAALPIAHLHIAGHVREADDLLVDTHGEPVCRDVWDLLADLGNLRPLPPVLIERDFNIPPLVDLLEEAAQARAIYTASHQPAEAVCR